MLRSAADEDLAEPIVRGLRRAVPRVDMVRVRDQGLLGASDSDVLAWAAEQGRVLITHDVNTLVGLAHERVAAGLAMPGVIAVPQRVPARAAIDDLELFATCGEMTDCDGRVWYLPLGGRTP